MVAGAHDLTGVLLEGRYRIGELLAVGGMSRVYRGTDTRLDRSVAVKVMDGRLAADPAFRGRLEREARAMARIEHPGVVDVHDHGEHGGGLEPLVFLVMELVEGATLRDLISERGALDPAEALAVLEPVLGALAAAHRQGMTHRDVKPENVLISHSGVVKVADFGLVTAAAAASATSSGMILGTPAYLSPEQVVGEGVSPRTDVYAAGILLFELLTGRPPYQGDVAISVAFQHVNDDVPPPSSIVPGLPPELDGLVEQATRRAAEERPADAETLLFAARGVRAALGLPSVPVPVPVKAGGRPRAERSRPIGRPATRALTRADWAPDTPPRGAAPTAGDAVTDAPAAPGLTRHAAVPSKGGWPAVRLLLIGAAVVLLLGVLGWIVGWSAGGGNGVVTPTLVGLDEPTAQRRLADAGLVGVVTERRDDTVPAGRVAATDPAAGVEVRSGSRVTLTVSTGRPKVPPIPPGSPVQVAEQLLREAGLSLRRDTTARRHHATAPAGTVIGTVPTTGTELAIGSPVTVVLSRGPARDPDSSDGGGGGGGGLGDAIADAIQRQIERALGGN